MPSSHSLNSRIFRTILVVGFSALLPKLALVARDLLIAYHFGTSDQVDSFLVALGLPSMVTQILVQAFASSLIPLYMHIQEQQGEPAANRFASQILTWSLAGLAAISLFVMLCSPLLIALVAPGFTGEKHAQAVSCLQQFAPLILLQGYAILVSSLLNARGTFAATTLLPATTPLLVLASFWISPSFWISHDLPGLSGQIWATLTGAVLEAGVSYGLLRRQQIAVWMAGPVSVVRDVLRQAVPMILGMGLINANLVVDQAFASLLGDGSVAALSYGNKVPAFILSMAALPVGTAVLPHFSRHAVQQDWSGLRHSLRFWSLLCFAFALLAGLVLMFLSQDVVRLLFERGKFTVSDVETVALIQICYLGQLPGYMLGYLGSRMATSIRMNNILMVIAGISFIINSCADFLLIRQVGLAGIALATALTYSCSAIIILGTLFRALSRRIREQAVMA